MLRELMEQTAGEILKTPPGRFRACTRRARVLESSNDNDRSQAYNVKNIVNGSAPAITTNDRGRLRVYLDDPAIYSQKRYEREQRHSQGRLRHLGEQCQRLHLLLRDAAAI